MARILVTLASVAVATFPAADAMVMTFVDDFAKYPGYTGSLTVTGTVSIISSDTEGSQVLMLDLSGLDPACTAGAGAGIPNGCGIHVHMGTSCADHSLVGGHYYSGSTDPWKPVVYEVDGSGYAVGSTTVATGLTISNLASRAFVIHKLDGGRIACGILRVTPQVASDGFSPYPGYSGSLVVSGSVTISEATSTAQVLTWDLSGLDPACAAGAATGIANGCGIHVHSGTSCADASLVGGHYFMGTPTDPWKPIVYVADGSGMSVGTWTVDAGVSLSDLEGKAFVVHELSGGRVGCGILGKMVALTAPTFSAYPGYSGSLSVSGTVTITEQLVQWDLSGLDPACTAGAGAGAGIANGCGIHVHMGTSCADHSLVGGHYFMGTSDPWSPIVYEVDGSGASVGSTTVNTGLTMDDMVGRAFVVHQENGGRVACGILFSAFNAPAPAPLNAQGKGDPHLRNIYGQAFDLMQPGKHTLVRIPRSAALRHALLQVDAQAQRYGSKCADIYFQELNVTGAWAEAKQTGGFRFRAGDVGGEGAKWIRFKNVDVKVVHGHTQQGINYLNVYIRHLEHAGFDVGGILGEDDHKVVATPSQNCARSMSFLGQAWA